MLKIVGRRLVTASAASPAILLSGSNLIEAPNNSKQLFQAMKFTVDSMQLDTYCMMADLSLEAEACGCPVVFNKERVPSIHSHIIHNKEDIAKLKVPNPYQDGRMPVFLECLRLMKKNLAGLKLACVTGPFTLALNLRGAEVYIDLIKDGQSVNDLMGFTTEVCTRYSKVLVNEGADMIIIAEPACSQLSSRHFNQFFLPYIQRVIRSINRNCVLHICGNVNHLIHQICQTGASGISIDEVDLQELLHEAPNNLVVIGNLSPVTFILESHGEVNHKTLELLDTVKSRSSFVIAPGCDLPPETQLNKIVSFVEAVKRIN
ncbi:MAG: uroporphyrinogen decarboxylase family protein [Dehalococcoidales bacterium]|nr:MAG: uroporphyrinogen decarboxylase family protein [Dehalococcoidales bacterium]